MKTVTASKEVDVTFNRSIDGNRLEVLNFKNGINKSGYEVRFSLNNFASSSGQLWENDQFLTFPANTTVYVDFNGFNNGKVLVRDGS